MASRHRLLGRGLRRPRAKCAVLQTANPREFLTLFQELAANPVRMRAMRRAGQVTARRYAWREIVEHNLLPRFRLLTPPRNGAQVARGT